MRAHELAGLTDQDVIGQLDLMGIESIAEPPANVAPYDLVDDGQHPTTPSRVAGFAAVCASPIPKRAGEYLVGVDSGIVAGDAKRVRLFWLDVEANRPAPPQVRGTWSEQSDDEGSVKSRVLGTLKAEPAIISTYGPETIDDKGNVTGFQPERRQWTTLTSPPRSTDKNLR